MSADAYSVVVIAVSVVSATAIVGHWIGAGLARVNARVFRPIRNLEQSISTTAKEGEKS